jgi:hypothetical protein
VLSIKDLIEIIAIFVVGILLIDAVRHDQLRLSKNNTTNGPNKAEDNKVTIYIVVMLLVLAVFAMFPILVTVPTTQDLDWWGRLGDYVVAVMAFGTLLVAIGATILLPKRIETDRQRAERTQTTIALSRLLYDRGFYADIVAPAWEIAVKWQYWTGQQGVEYRQQVAGPAFLSLGENEKYKEFSNKDYANAKRYQNLIRFHPHLLPYDWPWPGQSFHQLSEHMVLVVWIRFWCQLQILAQQKLIDNDTVRKLFSEFYSWWCPFFREYRYVGRFLLEKVQPPAPEKQLELDILLQLENLEEILYKDFGGDKDYYNTHVDKRNSAQTKGEAIWERHEQERSKTQPAVATATTQSPTGAGGATGRDS